MTELPAGNGLATFAVSLDMPEWRRGTLLAVDLAVPAELLEQHKNVTLTASVNGIEVGRTEYRKAGRFRFGRGVPPKALQHKPVEVAFSLDKAGRWPDGRPLGIIVVSVALKEVAGSPEDGGKRAVAVQVAGRRECDVRESLRRNIYELGPD